MTGLGGRRQRRVWLLVAVVCVLVVVACAGYVGRQLSHGGLQASDTAGLAAVGLAVVAGLVAVVALRKQAQANTAAFADASLSRGWAATLAGQVEAGEGAVRRQLLGDDTKRINLAYRLHPDGARPARAPGAGRLFADSPGGPALPDIVSFHRETRPERLVITGAGGAGKTVLALEVLLALIEGRGEGDPVPVRVPLSRWDTERQTLPELLRDRLVEAYDWPPGMAEGLVRHGMVLPVLDGLDEMDPPGPGGGPDPAAPRATAVVKALNAYQRGREAGPLILTCRTEHYDALPPQAAVVDAARIEVEPVGPTGARDYLAGRALDSAQWQPLTHHLAADPTGMLAGVLSTPWRLGLTATVYHREGNPGELLALPDAGAVDEHLLARYIPTTVRTTPNPHRYTAEQVHHWLHHLTRHLDPTGNQVAPGTPGTTGATDLLLHELWPLAGRARVRTVDFLLTTLTVLAPALLVPDLAVRLLIAGLAAMAGLLAIDAGGTPQRWENPFRTPGAGRLAVIPGITIAAGITLGLTAELIIWLAFGITFGIVFAPVFRLERVPDTSLGSRAPIRSDTLVGLAFGTTLAMTIGVMAGIAGGFLAGFSFGLTAGLAGGLTMGGSASRRYLVFLICSRRRLPFRQARFLGWAAGAGLLRYSGPGFQYRHRELQHWLRRNPAPPHLP